MSDANGAACGGQIGTAKREKYWDELDRLRHEQIVSELRLQELESKFRITQEQLNSIEGKLDAIERAHVGSVCQRDAIGEEYRSLIELLTRIRT